LTTGAEDGNGGDTVTLLNASASCVLSFDPRWLRQANFVAPVIFVGVSLNFHGVQDISANTLATVSSCATGRTDLPTTMPSFVPTMCESDSSTFPSQTPGTHLASIFGISSAKGNLIIIGSEKLKVFPW
jgi:hypothetical protein